MKKMNIRRPAHYPDKKTRQYMRKETFRGGRDMLITVGSFLAASALILLAVQLATIVTAVVVSGVNVYATDPTGSITTILITFALLVAGFVYLFTVVRPYKRIHRFLTRKFGQKADDEKGKVIQYGK